MPSRVVRGEINDSRSLNSVSLVAELTFHKLLTVVDDWGRFDARPAKLKAALFAMRTEVSPEMVDDWVHELERDGCVQIYSVDERPYLLLKDWDKHRGKTRQGAKKYPDPGECPVVPGSAGENTEGITRTDPVSEIPPESRESRVGSGSRESGVDLIAVSAKTDLSQSATPEQYAFLTGVLSDQDTVCAKDLVRLLSKDLGTDDHKLEWLEYQLPLMICTIEAEGVVKTRRQAMARLRELIYRWYRHQHPRNGYERASTHSKQAPESFDEAAVRRGQTWVMSLK